MILLLDTTILIYAVGTDHPLQAPCRRLLQLAADGTVTATTTVEAVQEFVHVRARRRPRPDAAALGRAYATLLAPLSQPGPEDLRRGLDLFESQPDLGAFDAILAATARRLDAALVSADHAFRHVPDLRWIDPGVGDLDRVLQELG